MYPQTHIYFAERVLGKQGDIISLGSILPDMLVGSRVGGHYQAHCIGLEFYRFLFEEDSLLPDFDRAVSTHGFDPKGLDYYGDEQYLDFERGFCFEKARAITERTVDICNIPTEMGWWKAHNVIEMGVETIISAQDDYCARLASALSNQDLINNVDETLRRMYGSKGIDFINRTERFSGFIEKERATAESLADKFYKQMWMRHNVRIDLKRMVLLINDAADLVSDELREFFDVTAEMVRDNLQTMGKE